MEAAYFHRSEGGRNGGREALASPVVGTRKRRKEGSKEHDFGQPGKGQPQPGSASLGQVKTGLDIGL